MDVITDTVHFKLKVVCCFTLVFRSKSTGIYSFSALLCLGCSVVVGAAGVVVVECGEWLYKIVLPNKV